MRSFLTSSSRETCLNPSFPTRKLDCPHCDQSFEAARRAVTLKCPHCARPLSFQDVVCSRSSAENLTTMGAVRITRRGSLRGRIDCSELDVQGLLSGTVRVRGRATLGPKAVFTGSLRVDRLAIEPGARLRGTICIGALPLVDARI